MAYDKIIVIRSRLDRCLSYAQNEEKTGLADALRYIENPAKANLQTAINCGLETAFQEMQATKQRWNKCGGILGYHIVHSYAPGEVSPEQAHAAGVEFAKRLLGSQYEAVICTHVDREHLHCHIVFNSVSFLNGKKYRSDFKSYFETLRGTSNAVSRDYGLSVIEPDGKGKPYAAWDAERNGKTTLRNLIRQDIDAALSISFTLDSFLRALRNQGYMIKHGPNVKHTAIKPPGGQRFIRLDSLGEGYTEADILQRLRAQRSEAADPMPHAQTSSKRYVVRKRLSRYPPVKRGSFRALYLYYFYLLSPRKKQRQKISFQTRAEVRKLKQYTQQFRLLQKYRIDSQSELTTLEDALQAEIDALTDARKQLYMQRRASPSEYVDTKIDAITAQLRPLRRELRLCGKITENMPRIRRQVQECRQNQEQPHAPEPARERRNDLWR